jgi:hypothetical protein
MQNIYNSIAIAHCDNRWALSPISVMSDIGLSLYRTVRYRTERLNICRIFRYRTKVFSDSRYPTSKFLKSCCTGSLKKQTELNLHLATVTFESFDYVTTNFLLLMLVCRVETKIFVFVFSRKKLTKSYENNERFR